MLCFACSRPVHSACRVFYVQVSSVVPSWLFCFLPMKLTTGLALAVTWPMCRLSQNFTPKYKRSVGLRVCTLSIFWEFWAFPFLVNGISLRENASAVWLWCKRAFGFNRYKKASFYIAQYPVLKTAQSALHFTSLEDQAQWRDKTKGSISNCVNVEQVRESLMDGRLF